VFGILAYYARGREFDLRTVVTVTVNICLHEHVYLYWVWVFSMNNMYVFTKNIVYNVFGTYPNKPQPTHVKRCI
jgi:hypothetical protein